MLIAGTTWAWINISTDEYAVCRYNLTNSGFNYATQGTDFTNTGGTAHSFNYSGLVNNQTYTLYYKCNDSVGNINPTSVVHVFSVKSSWHILHELFKTARKKKDIYRCMVIILITTNSLK